MNIKDKIQEYINFKSIKISEFEQKIGVSKSYWYNTIHISADVLVQICLKYPDLNVDWLIYDTGKMISEKEISEYTENFYMEIIHQKDEQINRLLSLLEQK